LLAAPGPQHAGQLPALGLAQHDPVGAGHRPRGRPGNGVPINPTSLTAHTAAWSATRRSGTITPKPAAPPASTKTSLQQRLSARARAHCPQLSSIEVRFRGAFAYATGQLPDGDPLPLIRLRYGGSATRWGFAIYRASHEDYQDSILPTGAFAGTPEDAPDRAAGLYLNDPTAWI
jgi:hypothetical protein